VWPVFLMLNEPALARPVTLDELRAGINRGDVKFVVAGESIPLTEQAQLTLRAAFEGGAELADLSKDWRERAANALVVLRDGVIPAEASQPRRFIDMLAAQIRAWSPQPVFSGPPITDPDRIGGRMPTVIRREVNTVVGRVSGDTEKGEVQEV